MRQRSNSTWVVVDAVMPIFCSGAPNSIPSAPAGTWNADTPLVRSSEVRANTR